MNFTKRPLLAAALALAALATAPAQVNPTRLQPAFTNNVTAITNGATTFATTTNHVIDLQQGSGLAFGFSALATNAGQLTFYFVPSLDGTNYTDALAATVWGNTLNASGWITRNTNFPASFLDNYRKIKVLISSNAAAYVVISNANFGLRN